MTLLNLHQPRQDSFSRTGRVLAGTHLQNRWLSVFHINWGSTCSYEGKPEIRNLASWSPGAPKINAWCGDEYSRSLFHKLGYHWISNPYTSWKAEDSQTEQNPKSPSTPWSPSSYWTWYRMIFTGEFLLTPRWELRAQCRNLKVGLCFGVPLMTTKEV